MSDTFNIKELDNLNEQEKQVALQILKDLQEKGISKQFNDLKYADYKEIPVDIETFITDDNYMGQAWKDNEGKLKLYPYWMGKLKELFPDNLTTNVNTFIASGARGLGKMNPLDTPVLTKYGFKPMGDIKPGEMVFGRDGLLHKVLQVFPHEEQDIYEVKFSDGTKNKCGLDHLWQVIDHHVNKKHKYCAPEKKIVDTRYLLSLQLKQPGKNARFEIPMCQPIDFNMNQDLPLDPYLLGLLLGDGCLRKSSIALTTSDEEIIDNIKNTISEEYQFYKHIPKTNKSKAFSYYITKKVRDNKPNKYINIIKNLGLLNKKSDTKFIPNMYLYTSIDNRIKLLQGLLDTDGTANKSLRRCDGKFSYNINYATVSEQLKDNFVWLIQSLGGTAKVVQRQSKYINSKGELIICKPHYRIAVRLPLNIEPFKLKRKLNLYKESIHKPPVRYIVEVEKLPKKEKAQCIYIEGEEHLYIVNDFIVTHNTEVCIATMFYLLYRVMCLKNPLEFFRLKPTEKLVFALMNIKLELAEEIAISKFQNSIKFSPWFQSRGYYTGRTSRIWQPNEEYHIDIKIGSQADDLIGLPIYFAFFDEVSFQRNQDIEKQKAKAIDMIDTAMGGMLTRFVFKGKNPTLLCLASSKRSDKSFLEEHIKTKLSSEPDNVMIIDEPVWKVKPKGTYSDETFNLAVGNKFLVSQILKDDDNIEDYILKGYNVIQVPLSLKAQFIDNMDRALCDFAGISSSELSKYISGVAVKDCLDLTSINPFSKEIIEVGNAKDDTAQYSDFFDLSKIPQSMKGKPLFIHLDMSVSGDKTGIAGVWIKGKKPTVEGNPGKDLFFKLAFAVSIKAPKGRQISFEKNRNFIRWLKEQGFRIKEITSDTFQSYDLQQQLSAEGFNCSILSVDRVESESRVCKPYQYLKNVLYEQRIELFSDKLLEQELVNLERNVNTGKVDHPENQSKDQADALCGAVFTASKYAEEFAYDYGETLDDIVKVSTDQSANFQEQIRQELEDEMKQAFNPVRRQSQDPDKDKYLDFGMGKAQSIPQQYLSQGIIVF